MTLSKRLRDAFFAFSALALAACGGGDGATPDADSLVDMSIGADTAPVVLIEYASSVCPACANYHDTMHETIKTLADEGKVKFIFREFPRDQVDIAGFATARCAGPDKYFDVLGDLFANQQGLLAAARNGTIRGSLQAIAARHGMDQAKFESCLENQDIRRAISDIALYGRDVGVSETPTLFINDTKLDRSEARTPESLIALVEAAQ